jgi:hypothetical protein
MASPEEQSDVSNNEKDRSEEERIHIAIDVSPELHAKIKAAARENALSISEYLERILEESVSNKRVVEEQARHPVPSDILDEVYRIREQLLRESKGHTFEDSAEVIRQMREERTRELEARRHRVNKPLTREKLERILKVREEIIANTGGYTFGDSTELIQQMRDERTKELDEL